MSPITVSPAVLRKLKVEKAIEQMGRKYLCHPCNHVQRKPQPGRVLPRIK